MIFLWFGIFDPKFDFSDLKWFFFRSSLICHPYTLEFSRIRHLDLSIRKDEILKYWFNLYFHWCILCHHFFKFQMTPMSHLSHDSIWIPSFLWHSISDTFSRANSSEANGSEYRLSCSISVFYLIEQQFKGSFNHKKFPRLDNLRIFWIILR